MTIKTDATGQIQKRDNGQGATLVTLLQRMEPEIKRALPKHIDPGRMARIVLTALRTTPKLADTSPESFLGCVMQTSQLGLEPNTPLGHAYLIPRWSGKRKRNECTLLVGYKGYIALARRSGEIDAFYAHVVREGDLFSYSYGLHPAMEHVPSEDADRETKPITHAYAVAHIKGATIPAFIVLSKAQIDARRARSETGDKDFSPWKSDYEAMAKKSAVRALHPWIPMSTEMERAISIEDSIERDQPTAAADPEVSEVLARHGLLESDTGAEVIGDVDPDTGEVLNVKQDQKPALQQVRERVAAAKQEPKRQREPGDDDGPTQGELGEQS